MLNTLFSAQFLFFDFTRRRGAITNLTNRKNVSSKGMPKNVRSQAQSPHFLLGATGLEVPRVPAKVTNHVLTSEFVPAIFVKAASGELAAPFQEETPRPSAPR